MSERIIIETPENIAFGYDVAGIGSRFLAALVDAIIQGTIVVAVVLALLLIGSTGALRFLPDWLTNWIGVLFILALFLLQFGYYIAFELFMGGQTPGKRLLNLRVIKENGYPLSPFDVLIRNVIRIIDFFPFAYGVGVIVMFLNERARRLGDFAAGTLVVNMHAQVRLSELQAAPRSTPPTPALPGVEYLREPDIELIESFLRRRAALKNPDVLAARLASTMCARLSDPVAAQALTALPDALFLENVVAAYREAHSQR
jgi:uncharacterized RDD family membrane protein YckC